MPRRCLWGINCVSNCNVSPFVTFRAGAGASRGVSVDFNVVSESGKSVSHRVLWRFVSLMNNLTLPNGSVCFSRVVSVWTPAAVALARCSEGSAPAAPVTWRPPACLQNTKNKNVTPQI